MSSWLLGTLLLASCIAGRLAGKLHEPSNVKVESRNFSLFLTWLPVSENPSFVTYKVQHAAESTGLTTNRSRGNRARQDRHHRWISVPGCENISTTECNFTCVLTKSLYQNQKIRVRTVSSLPNSSSSWVEIQNIQYMFTVDPHPPYLTVTKGKDSITIDSATQMPNCIPRIIYNMSTRYFVEISRGNNPKEVVYKEERAEFPLTVGTLGYKGEYCVAAKTIYMSNTIKKSEFSHSICLNFTEEDGHLHLIYLAAPLLFIIVSIPVLIWYKVKVKSKIPKALDFSDKKYWQKHFCVPDLYSEISHSLTIHNITEQDSPNKLLLPNKSDDGVNIYPMSGYMERRTMQTSSSHSPGYCSSKGLACNSSSDKSSSGCTNTSGSVTDMLFKAENDQTNNCLKETTISVLEEDQMFPSTSVTSSRNPLNSPSIMEPNSLGNVPFNTLRIIDMDNSNGESSNQCFTDSEEGLSTDYKTSISEYPTRDEIPHKDCSSDYTQRTYMSRR